MSNFSPDARSFMQKVIRIRTRLIKEGNSKLNPSIAASHIEELKRYLNFYSYSSNWSMALFWSRKKHLLLELIPHSSNDNHRSLIDEFSLLDAESARLLSRREYV
jgi:hypothetical protein